MRENVNYNCLFCGKFVDERRVLSNYTVNPDHTMTLKNEYDFEYVVSGSGRFKRKQYFHRSCYEKE